MNDLISGTFDIEYLLSTRLVRHDTHLLYCGCHAPQVACDGVWDEMSSAEAVQVVSELLANDAKAAVAGGGGGGAGANIADQLIEKVLEKVLARVKATFREER